jgi:hypothetical protein
MLATDYHSCKNLLDRARNDYKAIGNNTFIRYDEHMDIVVRYHSSDIVMLLKNGDVVITLAGWPTTTTKYRINQFIGKRKVYTIRRGPQNYVTYLDGIVMDKYEWYVVTKEDMYA